MVSKLVVHNLLINGVYWGYHQLTNFLITSWDIQVVGFNVPLDPHNGLYVNPYPKKDTWDWYIYMHRNQPNVGKNNTIHGSYGYVTG